MAVPLRSFNSGFKQLAADLWNRGLRDNEQALDEVRTDPQRRVLADELKVSPEKLLEFACRVDLARITGIGDRYAGLLNAAGVRNIQDLSVQTPEKLHESISELAMREKSTRRLPKVRQVAAWVDQAKGLPQVLEM